METFNLFIISLISCSFLLTSATHHHGGETRPTKLFVFGDSYADTGNFIKSLGGSWVQPYGTTFPGKPSGRFSDGRVLTDYIARFMGLKTPLAYRWMKIGGKKLRYGMNFAYGGSGVFNTLLDVFLPNMTTQIGFFEKLIDQNVYTKSDLQSSVVLVSLVGNDYATFLASGGTDQGLQSFIPRVINQLGANLKQLQQVGATKVAVTSLQPLGCLPRATQHNSFEQCNATQNAAVTYHNLLLQQTVSQLNNQSNSDTFFVLDLFNSFSTVLNQKGAQGDLKFETPLKPCCIGVDTNSFCGAVDEKGVKLYTVCSDPKSAFFWDGSHPTEAGWRAVYTTLKSSLEQNFNL